MYCPNCKEEFSGKFCPECGTKLIDNDTAASNGINLSLGDGNAISGGVSITRNHTIIERSKSADEIIVENENKYMNQCKRSLTDLVITNEEAAELESLRLELSISPDRANELLEQVRQIAMKSNQQNQLTGVAKIKAKQFYDAIAKNNPSLIKMMLPAIEAYAASNQNEELQFNYYMALAALEPISCINAYEKRKADNYWMSFWTYLSYVKENRLQDSEILLAEIDIKFPEFPPENTAVLASAGILITQGPEVASDFLYSIEGNYSPILQHFLDAITSAVDNNAKIYNGSQFYTDNLLPSCNLSEIAKRQAKIEMQLKIEEARKIASRDSRFEYNEDCSILLKTLDDFEDSDGYFELPLCVKQIGYQLNYEEGQAVDDQGFVGVTGLRQIKLHDNLEIIGITSFQNTKIEKLDIPDSVKEIHALAFSCMHNLKRINLPKCKIDTHGLFWDSSIEHVEIPEGVTTLKSYMFSKTPDLDSVILPNTIINIEKYAFNESAIRTVDIPEGTKEIQTKAFESCYNLKTISLPSSLFKIKSGAFWKCKMIQHVYLHGVPRVVGELPFASCSKFKLHIVDIEPSNELELFLNEIKSDVRLIYVKSEEVDRFKSAIPKYSSLIYAEPKKPETEYEMRIEESRTQAEKDMRIIYNGDCSVLIGTNKDFKDSSFELPLCVKQISTFEDNLRSDYRIPNLGFSHCQELKTIKLHDNLEKIGIDAFRYTNIEEIVIPDSVQEIGKYAFAYTKNLKHITLPAQCRVDTFCLFEESAIESIRIPEGTTTIDQEAFFETHALRHVDIPSTVTSINVHAFFRSGIRSITLPEGLRRIDSCAFAEAADLEIANLPSTLTEINGNAFSDSAIKEAMIPEGVKILSGAYLRCKNLTTISLPQSLIELNDFHDCVNLNDVYLRAVPKSYSLLSFSSCSFNLHLINLAPSDELLSFINTFRRKIKKIYVEKADLNQFTSAFPLLSSLIEAEQAPIGKTEECSIVSDSTPKVIETAEIVKLEATTEAPIVADSTPPKLLKRLR